MQDDNRGNCNNNCGCDDVQRGNCCCNDNCGCGNGLFGGLFGRNNNDCGCGDGGILFFIIVFLLLFTNCGCNR